MRAETTTWLLIAGGLGLILGVALLVYAKRRIALRARALARPYPERIIGQFLTDALAPEFREYLRTSSPPPGLDYDSDDEMTMLIERLSRISLQRTSTARKARIGLDEVAVGLAVLELRLAQLTTAVSRLDQAAINQDKAVWIVLSTLGVIVGVLAGIVGIIAGIVELIGP